MMLAQKGSRSVLKESLSVASGSPRATVYQVLTLHPNHHHRFLMDTSSSASATEADNLYVERLDALLEKQVADIATFATREGRPADEVASVP